MEDKPKLQTVREELRAAIAELNTTADIKETGIVTRVGDGVAWVYGLRNAGFNEMVSFETTDGKSVFGFTLSLLEDEIGAVLLGDDRLIKAGARVQLTGEVLEIPVGPDLIGRVIDPLGNTLDGKGDIPRKLSSPIEKIAPGVIERQSVREPLMTGIMAIDAMIPIGRGQRELIIGDRQIGKTAIAVDTILNQTKQNTDVISIYVAIGQKTSKLARIIDRLEQAGAMAKSIVIATSAADPAALQYLAPYSGTAIGEYFRDNGQHALIVHDDLSKHAWAYRQLSLLLRRPAGREAYPGDVFYLHSRLLERAAKMSDSNGGGSLTALPVIETQQGDVSAYIPTNVISITDGQIYLESDLFYQGIRPALNVGLSVSRVGGSAQNKAMKSVAGPLRLALAQFRELAAFAQFSTDLDADTRAQIERGRRLTEILKQGQYQPMSLAEQVVVLLAATSGAFDVVPVEQIKDAQAALIKEIGSEQKLLTQINETGQLNDKDRQKLEKIAQEVAGRFKQEADNG